MTLAGRAHRAATTAAVVALLGALGVPAGAASSSTVRVNGNRFEPFETAVDVDGTVRWIIEEDGHTIVADDDRFAFRGRDGGALPPGAVVTYRAGSQPGYVAYYCEIHGGRGLAGMAGRIRVGDPPRVAGPRQRITRVPDDVPTLTAAVAAARPGDRIEIAPGEHPVDAPIAVDVRGLSIVGTGRRPGGVVLAARGGAGGLPPSALVVTAPGVRIENLSVRGFRRAGIHIDAAERTHVERVAVDGGGVTLDAVLVSRSSGVTLQRTTTTGARRAGVRVTDCGRCGTLIAGATSHHNLVGMLIEAARGVVVRRATVTGNSAGIVARASSAETRRPVVVTVLGSRVHDNRDRGRVPSAEVGDRFLAVGAGIWLDGPADSYVVRNRVHRNGYGIVVAGAPAVRTEVEGNHLADNVDADLAWDGLGSDVCFGVPAGAPSPSSDPPAIAALYPCGRPTVGVPYPVVTARLARRAAGR